MNKLLIIIALCFQLNVSAQCLTDHYYKEAKKNNPQIAEVEKVFFEEVPRASNAKRATVYIIPVVFHVIHTNGPENISKSQIENQIKILNEDFSLTNANKSAIRSVFTNVAADCQFEFRLAKIDPQGNCTDGINRVYSPLHSNARDNVKAISGARWPNTKYLNIWTVSSIQEIGTNGGVTLGYATFPFWNDPSKDGIVMRADYVGVIGTGNVNGAGRTLTHEIGHYLGLFHTFTDSCDGVTANEGDFCEDTPPVAGTFTNANCPVNGNSCHTEFPDKIDQWENYMDYSKGSCQAMFSQDQKSIMHHTMETISIRSSLSSTNNLVATGVNDANVAPKAYFYSSTTTVCAGEPVYFYDISCKAQVSSKQWNFTGGSITMTNKDTPVVTYKTPGKYKVTLTVTNSFGSNSLTIDNYITVKPSVAVDKPAIVQGFESPTWNVGTGWTILDQSTVKFKTETTAAWKGSNSLVAPISSSVPLGQRFQLVTVPVDLRPLKGKTPKISMMVAYLRKNTNSAEELRMYYSRGCDNKWTQFLYRNAGFIAYNSNLYAPTFIPTSPSHWKLISFNLGPAFENDSNISFMIEVVSAQGNPVYIDDINISQYTTDITEVEKTISLNVFPNPSTGELNVNYENTGGETSVWLENIEGKHVATLMENTNQTGEISVKWNHQGTLTSGIYVLKIKSNEQVINKKVIFAN